MQPTLTRDDSPGGKPPDDLPFLVGLGLRQDPIVIEGLAFACLLPALHLFSRMKFRL